MCQSNLMWKRIFFFSQQMTLDPGNIHMQNNDFQIFLWTVYKNLSQHEIQN